MKILAPHQSPKLTLNESDTALDHLDLVPGGRAQVRDENVGAWLGAPAY